MATLGAVDDFGDAFGGGAVGAAEDLARVLVAVAQIPPRLMRMAAPWIYAMGVLLLVAVAVKGDIAMGAQRWLDLGFIRFQPSEIMKIAVPLCCAWYLHERPLPPDFTTLVVVAEAFATAAVAVVAHRRARAPPWAAAVALGAAYGFRVRASRAPE